MSTPEQPTASDPAAPAKPTRAARGAAARAPVSEPAPATDGPADSPADSDAPDATVVPVGPVADAPTGTDTDTTAGGAPTDTAEGTADGEPEKRRRGRPKGSTARTTRTIELILTVSGTVDGDWQAELKQGSSWLSRGLPVTAAAVIKAARELHAELADPIESAIGAAREQRAARVAALEAELEQARKALAEMDG